jgi:uncharacterized membrane protein YbhN (UPF0104 family)
MSPREPGKEKSIFNTRNIFLVLGIGLFLYMLFSFGIDNILIYLGRLGWYFIPILCVWFFVYICNTIAWQFIIKSDKISFDNLLAITIGGYALNYITPFFKLGGEPYRAVMLKEKLGTDQAVSATISYLMLHFLSSFLIWITATVIILFTIPLSSFLFVIFTAGFVVFSYVSYLFIKGYKYGVTKNFASVLMKLPLLNKFSDTVENKEYILNNIDGITRELYHNRKKDFLAANFFEYLSRLVTTFEYYFILKAIGFEPSFADIFIINAGAGLVSNLFFIVPFELGVKEGGLYTLLGFLQYTPSIGIFVSIVNRLRELSWILIGLILITLLGRNSTGKKLKSLRYDESNIV